MFMSVSCLHVYILCVPVEVRRESWLLWNWNYGRSTNNELRRKIYPFTNIIKIHEHRRWTFPVLRCTMTNKYVKVRNTLSQPLVHLVTDDPVHWEYFMFFASLSALQMFIAFQCRQYPHQKWKGDTGWNSREVYLFEVTTNTKIII